LTIGGGTVIDPQPSQGRRQRKRWVSVARALENEDVQARLLALIEDAGAMGIDLDALAVRAGLDDPRSRVASLTGPKGLLLALPGDRFMLRRLLDPLVREAVSAVDRFHAAHPLQPGMARATLEAALPGRVAAAVASAVIQAAVERGQLRVADRQGAMARPGKGTLSADALPPEMQRVYDLYLEGGIAPPTLRDIQNASGKTAKQVLEIVGLLQRADLLIKVTSELSLAPEAHERLLVLTREHLASHGEIDVQAFKTMTGLSRKFVVPLLEHLDRKGITLRKGDVRIAGPSS
jgi:selenocysteine-specific elongation factor